MDAQLLGWKTIANGKQPSQKFTQSKLQREFKASLTEFQHLQKQALEKEKQSAQAARTALQDVSSPSEERGGEFGQQQEQEQLRLANQDEVDFQESMIIERESEIRNIEQSVGELNELFRDVAHMVHEQGAQLDIIEENVETTHDASRGAHVNLKQASNYQKSARSKAWPLLPPRAILVRAQLSEKHGAIAAIIVEVGPNRRKYHVQKAFLTHYSEYFSKALNGAWKEAKDKIIRLTDIEPAIFGLFIEWLYTQNLPNLITLNANKIDLSSRLWKIKLYVFADRFAVSRLRTALNLEIVKLTMPLHTSIWDYASIVYAFANLPSTDPLLDFFVDLYYAYWDDTGDESQDKDRFEELPREFLLRFFKRVGTERYFKKRFRLTGSYDIDICSYHQHATDQEKRECGHQFKPQPKSIPLKRGLRDIERAETK
ncbi:hypothetical protein IG631_19704 [Alternaria alternata]|nr:hypothetical protein IG631_19704 [Alternaria alternata]